MKPPALRTSGKSHGIAWLFLWLSLMCCVFEGAVRKWGVGDSSILARIAYLSKDMLMAAFFLLGAGRSNVLTKIGQPYLLIGIGLLGLGAMASTAFGVDPIGAVLSIRTFFILPLACWAAGRHLPGESLRRFALWIAILSLPMALLAVRQFYSSPDSFVNRYSAEEELENIATSGVSERVRATGTFSYITGFGEFAMTAVWAGIITFTLARTRRERWLGYAGLAAGMCCAFVSVSRTVALISCGLVAVWAIAGGQLARKAQVAVSIGTLVLAMLLFTGQWDAAEEISTTVYLRHQSANVNAENADSLGYRFSAAFIQPLNAIWIAPFGNGLGSEQAARMSTGTADRLGSTFESSWGRTVMELGVLGLLGFFATWGVVLAPLKAEYRKTRENTQKTVLAVTAASLLARALIGFQFNHTAGYFFWAASATVLALENGIQPPRPPAAVVRISRNRRGSTPTNVP